MPGYGESMLALRLVVCLGKPDLAKGPGFLALMELVPALFSGSTTNQVCRDHRDNDYSGLYGHKVFHRLGTIPAAPIGWALETDAWASEGWTGGPYVFSQWRPRL